MLDKNFDNWCKIKKKISFEKNGLFLKRREIWWCFIWENLWYEV